MYAVDDLSDAIDVTREFLTPVQVGMWLRLVLVVFFVSGAAVGGGTPPVGDVGTFVDGPSVDVEPVEEEPPEEVPPPELIGDEVPVAELLVAAAALFLVFLVLWLLFAILRALMDFVFVESLRSSEVHVRRYSKANLGRALRLFLFRVVVSILAFGPLVVGFLVVVLSADALEEVALASLGLLVLLAIPIYLLYAVVMRFTTVFVVPIMLLEERTVLSAWKRFWPTFTANWTEYVVYLILVWIIWVLVGIVIGLLAVFGVLLIGLPFGILAVILALLGSVGIALAVVTLLVAFVLFLVFITLIEVPIYSYLRYYALLVLGDTDRDLDLIPEQRAAVRRDGGWDQDDQWQSDDEDERRLEEDDGDDGWGNTDDGDDGWGSTDDTDDTDDGWGNTDDTDDGWGSTDDNDDRRW